MTYREDLEERMWLEEAYAKGCRAYDLKVTQTKYGTVTVQAHSLEEAKEIVEELGEDDIDWNDWDTEVEEDTI